MDKADKKASNLRLTLVDATSHERLWSLRFSKTRFIIANISVVVVTFLVIFGLIAFTPIRTFIPGYPNAQSRRQAVQNAQRIDSLQTRILQWELYTENLRRVVAGEDPIRLDTLMLGREGSRTVSDARYLAIRDSLLRADVVQEEQFGLSSGRRLNLPIEAMAFYTPVKGVVSKGLGGHYGARGQPGNGRPGRECGIYLLVTGQRLHADDPTRKRPVVHLQE